VDERAAPPAIRDAVRALEREIVEAAGESTGDGWGAPRWVHLALALWPKVKAELDARDRVVVLRRNILTAAVHVASGKVEILDHTNGGRGGIVWVPPTVASVHRALLDEVRNDAQAIARSIHSGRLLRKLAEHGQALKGRGDALSVVIEGGFAGVATWAGFKASDDAQAIARAAMFWDSVRMIRPEDDLNVAVLMMQHGPGPSGRPVVKLTPGEALIWHEIQRPRSHAEVRPVPVPALMPPWALDRKYRGAEAWAQLELVALLNERAEEFAARGGVQLTPEDWRGILDAVGVPSATRRTADVGAVLRDGWAGTGDQGDLLPFIVVESGRVSLAPAHEPSAEFIRKGAERRGRARRGGAAAAAKKRRSGGRP
jgi:hypothetical protein